MVKVLPTTFTLFESQNIINSSAEPLCISCSEKHVFVACEGCVLEVYTLYEREQIAKIRTISPVSEIVYNKHGDCIVTVEARNQDAPSTVRVYFNWRGIGDAERPQRVVLMDSSFSFQDSSQLDAEIVELPVENCSCVSVCDLTGMIAVGSERTIRLFAMRQEPTSSLSTGGYKLLSIMDIRTDMKLRKVKICGNYVACISTHRIRVLKFFITGSDNHPWSRFQPNTSEPPPKKVSGIVGCKRDSNFLSWSPSKIWEMEAKVPGKPGAGVRPKTGIEPGAGTAKGSSSVNAYTPSDTSSPPVDGESDKQEVPETSESRPGPLSPLLKRGLNVSTITLPTITRAVGEARRDSGKHELEVLGPVEFVWGQPLTIHLQDELGENAKCQGLTMLYRRFASSGYAYIHVSSNENNLPRAAAAASDGVKQRSATLGSSGASVGGGLGGKHRGGIHSVQLVPTLTVSEDGVEELIGMACVLANRTKGYLYDIFEKTKLITSIAFMSKSQTVCFDGNFLHTLSPDMVDSYTSRVTASVISRQKFTTGKVDHTSWISKPCPSPSLELTLISSNKFIGCFELASSPTHNVVLCKLGDASPPAQRAADKTSFLQSLTMRRQKPISRGTWNIYILEKKPILGMFKQFVETATGLGKGAPPVLQHQLSEAHLLLRSLAIQNPTGDVISLMKDNCFSLAESFCQYLADDSKNSVMSAAGYFVLSGRPIVDVIDHVLSQYSEGESKTPFVILLSYLNLVLFEQANASQLDTLHPLANQILELYTKYDCDFLPVFVLFSWLKGYSKDKALELLRMLVPKVKNDSQDKSHMYDYVNLALCYLLCELDCTAEAMDAIGCVSEDYLLTWTKQNQGFVFDAEEGCMNKMGNVMMQKCEGVLLKLFSHVLSEGSLDWDTLCAVLRVSDEEALIRNHMLKKLTENIVTGIITSDPEIIPLATEVLTSILIKRVSAGSPVSTTSCVTYSQRYSWLNKLPPFETGASLDERADSVLYTNMSQSSLRDLMELQSLLCSSHMTPKLASHVHRVISGVESPDNNVFMTSLRLLTWPLMDRLSEATWLILEQFPPVVVEFCKTYYHTNLTRWKVLLDGLQRKLDGVVEVEENNSLKSVYQDVLKHIATFTSPEELMSLLPPNGNVMFFLPVIELSCKLYLAGNIANSLHSTLTGTLTQ